MHQSRTVATSSFSLWADLDANDGDASGCRDELIAQAVAVLLFQVGDDLPDKPCSSSRKYRSTLADSAFSFGLFFSSRPKSESLANRQAASRSLLIKDWA